MLPVTTARAALYGHPGVVSSFSQVTVAPVILAELRKSLTRVVISPVLGSVFVRVRGVTAKRAPSRAASVKTCCVFINRLASKTPKRSRKNTGRMIADSTIAVPLSEVLRLCLASIFITLSGKMRGSAEPRSSAQGCYPPMRVEIFEKNRGRRSARVDLFVDFI